jgi:hypothetical protein
VGRAYPGVSLNGVGDRAVFAALNVIDLYLRDQRTPPPTSGGGGGGGGLPDETYIVVSASVPLTNERVLAVTAPVTKVDGGPGGNMTLGVALAAPAFTFGTANSAGAAGTLVRSDATIAIFDSTDPADISLSAPSQGVAAVAARRDHVHFLNQALMSLNSIGGTLSISKGGTGQTAATTAFSALAPTTVKGDLIVRTAASNTRLPVGANGQLLTADSAMTEGVKWADQNTSFADNVFEIFDNFDNTRIMQFGCGGISSGNTRVLTAPDDNGTLVLLKGQLGGSGALPDVRGLRETSGPTLLTMGAVADGEFLKRSGTTIVSAAASGGGPEFPDNTFRVTDNGDSTKKLAFEVSGVTTATTRTVTVRNFAGSMVLATISSLSTDLLDDNGVAAARFTGVASAVNRVQLKASATGGSTEVNAIGTDTDISLTLNAAGTVGIVQAASGGVSVSEVATRSMIAPLAALHFAGAMS